MRTEVNKGPEDALWVTEVHWKVNGSPLQCSCLGNPMDRGAWQATAHEVAKKVRHDLATKQQVSPYTTNVHKKAQRADS